MFAEAVRLYRTGRSWWPDTTFEREHIKGEQEARYQADSWEESIKEWLGARDSVLIKEVATGALGLDTPRLGRREQNRIADRLERLGWEQGPEIRGG